MTVKSLAPLAAAARRIADNTAKRDQAILDARREGHGWDAIAAAAKLTPMGAQKIAKRLNEGKLPAPVKPGA